MRAEYDFFGGVRGKYVIWAYPTSDGSDRYLVRAPDRTRWILAARGAGDCAVRWVGVPLALPE